MIVGGENTHFWCKIGGGARILSLALYLDTTLCCTVGYCTAQVQYNIWHVSMNIKKYSPELH